MRAKVQASIEALGYVPNISARSLRTGRSGLIGLAVPRVTDPYFCDAPMFDTATWMTPGSADEKPTASMASKSSITVSRRCRSLVTHCPTRP